MTELDEVAEVIWNKHGEAFMAYSTVMKKFVISLQLRGEANSVIDIVLEKLELRILLTKDASS